MEGREGPWWGLAWWIWALGCLVVAVVYFVVDTEGAPATGGWQGWILRWGHSLCWLLLAASFVIRMTPLTRWAHLVAGAGGLVYLGFLILKFAGAKS